ncbi:MAG: hypothetical protein FWC21_03175 [Treponema sp.]|nr:hypothetical protein [Treponema sp.]
MILNLPPSRDTNADARQEAHINQCAAENEELALMPVSASESDGNELPDFILSGYSDMDDDDMDDDFDDDDDYEDEDDDLEDDDDDDDEDDDYDDSDDYEDEDDDYEDEEDEDWDDED